MKLPDPVLPAERHRKARWGSFHDWPCFRVSSYFVCVLPAAGQDDSHPWISFLRSCQLLEAASDNFSHSFLDLIMFQENVNEYCSEAPYNYIWVKKFWKLTVIHKWYIRFDGNSFWIMYANRKRLIHEINGRIWGIIQRHQSLSWKVRC